MSESEPSFKSRAAIHCEELGYSDLRVLKEESQRAVYEAKEGDRLMIVKVAELSAPAAANFRNQALAQKFLRGQIPDQDLVIPKGRFESSERYAVLAMEQLAGQTFAESVPDGLRREISEADEDRLIAWLSQVRAIPTEQVPQYFKDLAETKLNDDFYAARLEANAAKPLEQGLLSAKDLTRLKKLWRESLGPVKTFQHHDVVPFNMVAMVNGRLGLIDAEYARLGMPGYDAAYYFIQTSALLNRPTEAKRFLDKFLTRWEEEYPEDNMRTAIQAPLAYRIVANLQDAGMADTGVKERTLALVQDILNKRVT